MTGSVRGHRPAVIRVRKETWRDGSRYVMNHWLPVPDWMRRLDGRTWRGVLLALLALLVVGAYALARLIGGTK